MFIIVFVFYLAGLGRRDGGSVCFYSAPSKCFVSS